MGGEVSTDFKSSNRIEISQLVQVLLNFEWFQGSPRGVGVGVGGWTVGGGERVHPTHVHTHTHACTHMHTRAYDIIGNSQGFPQWGRPFAIEIIMFTMYMCMHVYVHACMHMYRGHPQPSPPPSTHTPTPRATGSLKHQNSISLELIEIIQFCLKILYLWTFLNSYRLKLITLRIPPTHLPHPPRSRGNPNQKNYNNFWTKRDNWIPFEDLGPLNPTAHIQTSI